MRSHTFPVSWYRYIHIEFTNADPEILQFKRKRDGYVCKINIECVDMYIYMYMYMYVCIWVVQLLFFFFLVYTFLFFSFCFVSLNRYFFYN